MTETFAAIFRKARRNARDPEHGGQLSQERFAELLGQQPGATGTTAATVSNWERGKTRPRSADRATLCAIVTVLLHCGGLAGLTDASTLLTCGGYAPLTQEELPGYVEVPPSTVVTGERNEHLAASTSIQLTIEPVAEALVSERTQPPVAEPMWLVDGVITRSDAQVGRKRTLIAVRHQSMEQIPAKAIIPALPLELCDCVYIEIAIDQCDLFHNGRLTDPYEAVRRQRDVEERVAALLARHPEAYLAYYSIAHIPLVFLAGYTLSHRRALMQFAEDRYTRTWDLLQRGGTAPALRLSGLPTEVMWEQGEVVIRISISYRVMEQVVAEVIPTPLASMELGLDQPQLDVVTSEQHVRAYTQAFRQMMDQIHQQLPRATGIHLFYAGPPALAFSYGQQVSKTIHSRIVVYNYRGMDVPKYSWGLDITRDIDTQDFVVRPAAC